MTVQVNQLQERLRGNGDGSGPGHMVEVPGELLGDGEGFRPVFADGVLRAVWEKGNADALAFTGSARTALADAAVPVEVVFEHDGGGAVTGARLSVELPAPGTPGEVLGRGLGIDVPCLPRTAVVSRVVWRQSGGTTVVTGEGEHGRIAVVCRPDTGRLLIASGGAWHTLCTDQDLTAEQVAALLDAADVTVRAASARSADGLAAGAWLVLPDAGAQGGSVLVPVRPDRARRETDPSRRDGLGRPMPVARTGAEPSGARRVGIRRVPHAVATDDGYVVLAPGALAGRGSRAGFMLGGLSAEVALRGFLDFGDLADGKSKSITYDKAPLYISGGLTLRKANPPYTLAVGGVLLVDTGALTGTAIAAAYIPGAEARPSFFAFGALSAEKGIGPPPFQVRGIAAGMGWRSNLRLPDGAHNVPDFPFIKALDDPRTIGARPDGSADALAVLDTLIGGHAPWVTPARGSDDPLWIVAGLAFTVAERLDGRAMLVLQTGADLTLGLLGVAGMSFPKEVGRRKYAHVEIGLEALLKPKAGELSLSAALTPNSFVLDPNCKLRGGVAFKTWFGSNPNQGDFVVTAGGYHHNYRRPAHYPNVPRLGFDWDLSGTVTVSGSAYLAFTPAAVMAGGALEVRFHSGAVRAWLTAKVDALIRWKPFYFDVGMRVSVGVQARVKVLFVKITITVEVGVSLNVWGPPTGGRAKIHLWFISFTVHFGKDPEPDDNALGWADFRTMLPPPETAVRVLPGAGLLADRPQAPDGETRGSDDEQAWQVSSAGFTFSTDSAVPVTELYLTRTGGSPAETGSTLNIRPMKKTGLTSTQRISLARESGQVDLAAWDRARTTASVPQALWGTGAGDALPAPGEQVIPRQLTGATLSSPGPDYGNDTGYITEEAFAFDPMPREGVQPLDPSAGPAGPAPQRPGGVIGTIARTVAAQEQTRDRAELVQALAGFGLNLGQVDGDLSAHKMAAETAFTADPMLIPA
ncbi:Transcriptional Activator SRCAP-Like Protein [Streptomyces leeuwenhoekii]|uniref:Transcriptional Activator SRCAP-Like Protein n=1 Tax=Streptomyces leeuwenhoekii TaxID=1437453 RepID=A0A0F7VYC7_STRLW|nr:Transcriptional Activator SRCAP-Like Protein [Streptomyces leeuwenhoekii]